MIKALDGIKETVEFEEDSVLMLYDNTDYEEYPTHWHSPVEIIMPLEGEYVLESNGIPYSLREGDIIIIAPGALHHIFAARGRRIIFQADTRILGFFKGFDSFFSFIQPAVVITPEDFPSIHEDVSALMKEIMDEYTGNAPLKNASVYSKFIKLLVLVGRCYTNNPDKFTDTTPYKQKEYIDKFMNVCDYINEHCTQELNLDDMAEMAGFSKYHFSRLFKEFSGVSFYKYVNMQKITHAEKLLRDPGVTITEAAVRSGYNSISAFMRMFKIVKGCTPTEFRNMKNDH